MTQLITSLAFTANAVAFALITYRSVTATIVHVQNGTPNNGMVTLATAFVAFFIMAVSAMPSARSNFTAMIDTRPRRFLVRLFVPCILGVTGLGITFVMRSDSNLVFGVLPEVYLLGAFAIYALLIIAVFAVPGFAFPTLRNLGAQQKAGFGYHSPPDAPKAQDVIKLPGWVKVLLTGPVFLFFAIAGSFVYGREADFLPSPEHVNQIANLQTAILAVFIPLFGILGLIASNKPGKWVFRYKAVQIPALILICGAMGFVVPLATTNGLPAVHSLFVTAPFMEQEVAVVKRGQSVRSKGCDTTADVAWAGAESYLQTLCDVPRELWETLVPGDRLLITGQRTQYGLRYDSIVRM